MGKHARPKPISKTNRAAIAVALASGIVAVPLLATSASAATAGDWANTAQNEAGGDWSIDHSSDGLSVGGLQFQDPSWQSALAYLSSSGYDTSAFPQSLYQGMPNVPSKDQQILAGEALLHLQGWGAWAASGSTGSPSMFDGGPNPWGLAGTNWPGSGGSSSGGAGGSVSTPPASTGDASGDGEAEDGGTDGSGASAPVVTPAPPVTAPVGAPASPATPAVAPSCTGATIAGGTKTYTVAPGNCLSQIALDAYGNASRWPEIYNANKALIGADPNLIQIGAVLTLP